MPMYINVVFYLIKHQIKHQNVKKVEKLGNQSVAGRYSRYQVVIVVPRNLKSQLI